MYIMLWRYLCTHKYCLQHIKEKREEEEKRFFKEKNKSRQSVEDIAVDSSMVTQINDTKLGA